MRQTISIYEAAMTDREQMYRYWVELRDLKAGSSRNLPLRTVIRVHIPTKKNEKKSAREERVQLQDGQSVLEASTFEELVPELARKYPDGLFERRLCRERDLQAEHAMDELARLIARAAVEKWIQKSAG
jgi:hypothetical protein